MFALWTKYPIIVLYFSISAQFPDPWQSFRAQTGNTWRGGLIKITKALFLAQFNYIVLNVFLNIYGEEGNCSMMRWLALTCRHFSPHLFRKIHLREFPVLKGLVGEQPNERRIVWEGGFKYQSEAE